MSGLVVKERRFVVHPAATLAALEAGAGTPVLLVHGSVGDMTEFRRPMVALAERFHVFAYSRRFHPPNPPPSADDRYRMALHAGDLVQVLELTGQAHLVGISWGGYAALVAATECPGLVLSLVLAEPPFLPVLRRTEDGRRHLESFLSSAIRPAGDAFRSGDGERGIALFMDGILGRAGAFEALPAGIRKDLQCFIPELALEITTPFDEYMPDVPEDRLAGVSIPVLLLQGSRSPAMFGMILDALEALLPRTFRERVPDAGHAIHLANPDDFIRRVLKFLLSREAELNGII